MPNPADASTASIFDEARPMYNPAGEQRLEEFIEPCPFQAINERRAASEDPEALRRARSL